MKRAGYGPVPPEHSWVHPDGPENWAVASPSCRAPALLRVVYTVAVVAVAVTGLAITSSPELRWSTIEWMMASRSRVGS